MACLFLRQGLCIHPNLNVDQPYVCPYIFPTECPEGVGNHMITINTNTATGESTVIIAEMNELTKEEE